LDTNAIGVVVVAGGSSRRMGFDKMTALLDGEAVVARSLRAVSSDSRISRLVLVAPKDRINDFERIAAYATGARRVQVVEGGPERCISVLNGLEALEESVEFVAIHDAARPLLSHNDLVRVLDAAEQFGAVSLAAPVSDTLKKADVDLIVQGSVDRTGLYAMQTPQVFRLSEVREACAKAIATGVLHTDEVSALQAAGKQVHLVLSEDWNLKITYPQDIALAEALLSSSRSNPYATATEMR
jgi:2-C-methyl-D-erythritol 4-phosphate cytidylyltransferase